MSAAQELRAAADRLDALAEAATRGPGVWRAVGAEDEWVIENELLAIADVFDTGDAAYIAAMSPTVGKALAAWLSDVAGFARIASNGEVDAALAVARAINAGAEVTA